MQSSIIRLRTTISIQTENTSHKHNNMREMQSYVRIKEAMNCDAINIDFAHAVYETIQLSQPMRCATDFSSRAQNLFV